jgi:hypothetical protein
MNMQRLNQNSGFCSPQVPLLTLFFGIVLTGGLAAQPVTKTNPASSEAVTYIPKDVPDAVRVLKDSMTKEQLVEVQDPSNIDNFFVEEGMRNQWGLWKDSRLYKYFKSQGITTPEEMSGIILDALVANLKSQPFDLPKEFESTRAGERQVLKDEKNNLLFAGQSIKKINEMMVGLRVMGKPAQVVTLPPRINAKGIRVRYIAPFAGGFLVTSEPNNDPLNYSPVYFLDLTKRTAHKLQIAGVNQVDNALVIGKQAYFEGPGPHGNVLISSDGKTTHSVESPPGSGVLRFGIDGDRLLAVRSRAVYQLQDGHWIPIVQTNEDIPVALIPPIRSGDRIYLRDEGLGEDNKRLWWIDLAHDGKMTCFDKDCGVVGPEGPRWENVWNFTVTRDNQLWLTPNYSLVRWDEKDGYRVALMNGSPTFNGQLIKGSYPEDSPVGGGWEVSDDGRVKEAALGATGMALLPDGKTLDVIGPNGLYRVQGQEITPLLSFKNLTQDVPTKFPGLDDANQKYHWSVEPTHLVLLPDDAFLIGNQWEGLYLLAKDRLGIYQFTALDEKIETDMTLDSLIKAK